MTAPDIIFPRLGLRLGSINRVAFSIGGFDVNWYGICIAMGLLVGSAIGIHNAKRHGIEKDLFMDFLLWALPIALVFTRLSYVLFNFNVYKDNLLSIFDVRQGGMMVYGGIISSIIVCIVFAKIKKVSVGAVGDAGAPGLVMGQVIGRIGNFINQEAFGDYTDGPLAMRLKLSNVNSANVTQKMRDNLITDDTIQYVQVHPTFLYEMLMNLAIFIFLTVYRKHKVFHGELLTLYVILYALGRFFIESLRTDQLMLLNTGIPISMLISAVLFVGGIVYYIYRRVKAKSEPLDI